MSHGQARHNTNDLDQGQGYAVSNVFSLERLLTDNTNTQSSKNTTPQACDRTVILRRPSSDKCSRVASAASMLRISNTDYPSHVHGC